MARHTASPTYLTNRALNMSVSRANTFQFIVLLNFLFYVSCGGSKSSAGHHKPLANNSQDSAFGDDGLLMPIWAYKSAAVYLLFINVMGLILNAIVILVLLYDQQLKMTPLNWMLLNLAFSDGISAGFGAPISIAAALNCGWPFGDELCAAYALITSTTGIGSITTLSALAVLRYKLVVENRFISAFANRNVRIGISKAAIILTLIWSYVLVVTSPPMLGWGKYGREAAHISCSVNWELKLGNNRSYIFYMFIFGLIVPMAVICVCYHHILNAVREVKIEMKKKIHLRPRHRLHEKLAISFQSEQAEKRLTLMVAVMVGAFLVAWTPYSVMALIETFTNKNNYDSVSIVFATVPSLFAKTSSVLNPIIYGFMNTQFKLAWKKMMFKFVSRLENGRLTEVKLQRPRSFDTNTGLIKAQTSVKPSVISTSKEFVTQLDQHHQEEQVVPLRQVKIEENNQQPVLLVTVRYLSGSIIHRIHLPENYQ